MIRGFKDTNEFELSETYAPVSRLPVIIAVFAVINKYDLEVWQLYFKTVFLNAGLDKDKKVYMEIPEGFGASSENIEKKVCIVIRAIYGLKISPKRWNGKFTREILILGLVLLVILILYVDVIIFVGNCIFKMNEIRENLSSVFQMKDSGDLENFLGIEIYRDRKNKVIKMVQSE